MLQCLTKIVTAKELDLRPLGKVIIFRDKQTDRTFLLYIDVLCVPAQLCVRPYISFKLQRLYESSGVEVCDVFL